MASLTTNTAADILQQPPGLNLLEALETELHQIKTRSNGGKRYQLQEYLGGNQGISAVVLAKDTRLGAVALKFVAARDDKTRGRFVREVAMLARVAHPNVVSTVGGDEPLVSKDQTLMVVVLEYLPGRSVDHLVRDLGTLDESHVILMAMDVLSGLIHVHEKGVIHKDIKCLNILCGDTGYKLADFGISSIVIH